MGEASPSSTVTTPTGAVFLSYASQDAEAAQRIAEALRAAGIEVWFDKSELRGGDVWDQTIRRQIHACTLFVPIVSQHTQERLEGYFRREWKLAIDRTHDMAEQKPFLVPVVIDGTGDREAFVPDAFRAVQWTRLPDGQTPPAFVERVRRLLSHETSTPIRDHAAGAVGTLRAPAQMPSSPMREVLVAGAVAVLGAAAYFAIERPWTSKPVVSSATVAASAAPGAFAPPPHSIAVLPFVNMSGDKEQEYFSDGLSEELLNDLSRISELQVAARTSAFSFKGKDVDIGTIARKLNVGAILEGSVRRSAHTIRVTAQLIDAVTGFHKWSQTYDRDLTDVLKLQTEIATSVAGALKVTLLGDVAAKLEIGGTHNPAAFDAYLKGWKRFYEGGYYAGTNSEWQQASSALFSEAVHLDPDYALAYMARSVSYSAYARLYATTPSMREKFLDRALADARKSVELAPNLGEGYAALAAVFEDRLEFENARKAYESARALSPGSARVWRKYSAFYAAMGFADEAVTAGRRAVTLDPLNPMSHCGLGETLVAVRRYDEALGAFKDCESLGGMGADPYGAVRGRVLYLMGDYADALASCEASDRESGATQWCLMLVYNRLGKHSEAKAELEKMMTAVKKIAPTSETFAYAAASFNAELFAQWGEKADALRSLEAAFASRDPDLVDLKTNPLLDPLRKEPRFQAIERKLKFPH